MSAAEQKQGFFELLQDVRDQLDRMEKKFDRKISEVSAEIHATTELVGMAEDTTKAQFGEVMATIQSITFSGGGMTAANTGVELDAVIDVTEEAANKIMDAADRISGKVSEDRTIWEDPSKREEVLGDIAAAAQDIVLACSFQDITGQRIRKTLENIESIEDRLGNALDKMGIDLNGYAPAKAEPPAEIAEDVSSQDDIDALFD